MTAYSKLNETLIHVEPTDGEYSSFPEINK